MKRWILVYQIILQILLNLNITMHMHNTIIKITLILIKN